MLIDKLGNITGIRAGRGGEVIEESFLLVPKKIYVSGEPYQQFLLPCKNMSIFTNSSIEGENIVRSETNANLYKNHNANSLVSVNLSSQDSYLSIYNGKDLVYAKAANNQIYLIENAQVNGKGSSINGLDNIDVNMLYDKDINNTYTWEENIELPYNLYYGNVVSYNGKLYAFIPEAKKSTSFILNNNIWEEVAVPFTSKIVSSAIYNNKLYVINGISTGSQANYSLYAYDGIIWEELFTKKMNSFDFVKLVSFENNLYLFLGSSCYIYDNLEWKLKFYHGLPYSDVLVFNNNLYMLGVFKNREPLSSPISDYKIYHSTYIYALNKDWFELAVKLPYQFVNGSAVVYNNEIHIMGGSNGQTGKNHFVYNGETWRQAEELPYNFSYGSAVIHNNAIHILGSMSVNYAKKHFSFN